MQSDENPTDKQHFMFKVFRVVKKSTPVEAQDPDVRLAQALLARSRNPGPQQELWIANSIAQFKAQGKLGTEHERLTQGVKFREAAGNVGHVAHVVAQLNKLKLRLNDGVRSLSTECINFIPWTSLLSFHNRLMHRILHRLMHRI